ncbi:type I methionyl aminopeptidase [Patescibacteria group bacterium]|nr:type I methionyl aminopeptidase [Patescibacteria group bacterium]MBU1663120.1 type I methionyl aminopeptidase [Patescibacteria group bacterium]MBU1933707.1 type I methionyl aminopeptidase [Patescibacteria group bacterium]MBU2008019.1 type I methionyl aminopeptidase [Patescibacteria group bacterium]MBU2233704.1 type I methionyl aminopeptidase [Patescibacteria group bacterium]
MITIKKNNEIELLRQGGKILGQILKQLITEVKPGVTTGHLEQMADVLIKKAGGRSSFKGFKSDKDNKPYPTVLCACINDEVVHAPSLPSRELKPGDIINIDVGMEFPSYASLSKAMKDKTADKPAKGGYYTDMAATVAVGKVSREAQKLIRVTRQALALGIKQVRPGNSLNNIGKTIEQYVKANNFSIVRDLVGHGVGYNLHEDPQIPNYDLDYNKKIILKPGMVLAIEPMVNTGDWRIKDGADGLTILTADGSLSAQFEHTVLVTENGYEILTKFE